MTPDPVPPARRDEGEELATYRRMLDTVNATLDAEGRRVGIEMGCDTAHWMAEEILGLRQQLAAAEAAAFARGRAEGLAGLATILDKAEAVQRAREEAAREQREECRPFMSHLPYCATRFRRTGTDENAACNCGLDRAIRSQPPGAGGV